MRSFWITNSNFLLPVLIVASVMVIIAPLPPLLLDLLLSANITLSVVILLTTIYVKKPLEFSVFPALLLNTTLLRLVLNVASTRLILTRGATGTAAAGGVIESFGEFVAGGSVAIGLIMFAILIAIQFLVITKGATRISEVAARFALDGMPGRQMAIDADLNAGLLKPEQARQRREEVAQQADFYGAMDGASKFVRGDAIASIVITLINIAGGMYIGMVENGMTATDAATVFTKLTIGDGLVSQIPALLISLASGLLVTRTSVDSNLPREILTQVFVHPEALSIAAVFTSALAFTGLPRIPLLALGGGLSAIAYFISQGKKEVKQKAAQTEAVEATKPPEIKPEDLLSVDAMTLELGYGLLKLADKAVGGTLLESVTKLRHRMAEELGIILPSIRVQDSIHIGPQQYQIRVQNIPIAWGEVYPDGLMAINIGTASGHVPGIETTDPSFGLPAVWIDPQDRPRAELYGWKITDPTTVIITHLTEIVRKHSDELLSRQAVHQLLDNLKQSAPKLLEELIPEVLKVSQIHQVLNNLLRERVPIRNLASILESLGDNGLRTKDIGILTEYARHALSRTICQQYRDQNRVMCVVTLDPALEDVLSAGISHTERGMEVKLSPQVAEAVTIGIAEILKNSLPPGRSPVVLVSPQIRPGLKQITSAAIPNLAVLGMHEATRDTQVESIGQVGIEVLGRKMQRT